MTDHVRAMSHAARIIGALALLVGVPVDRSLRLARTQVGVTGDGEVALTIGDEPLRLPPRLAALVVEALRHEPERRSLSRVDTEPFWLFLGWSGLRPPGQSRIRDELAAHGIMIRGGRNGALESLACDLPAAVLADLTGMTIESATRWTCRSRGNWHDYLAERRHENLRSVESGEVGAQALPDEQTQVCGDRLGPDGDLGDECRVDPAGDLPAPLRSRDRPREVGDP